ncbi:hypothetical protein NCS55_00204600 [Fusarium keratoplasticum]|nr:hypothetical protein NCS55_00204600 [Fusarium keratoplasticum]
MSGVALTPSVAHVNEKVRKASTTLAINGITATQEMRRLKEKNLSRRARDQGTSIVANYGPIRMSDARLRVAKDDYNRQSQQEEEERRVRKKAVKDEMIYIRRWVMRVRGVVRESIQKLKVENIYLASSQTAWKGLKGRPRREWWTKTDRRLYLSSAKWMSKRYALHREMREDQGLLPHWKPPITMPLDYDGEVVQEAVDLLADEEQIRHEGKKVLSLESDGLEIVNDEEEISADDDDDDVLIGDVIEVCQTPFWVPKEEESS